MFGYWPLPRWMAIIWSSYDNSINTITNLNMLYMSWARLRGIVAPTKYKDEWLIKNRKLVLILIWVIGLGTWTPITNAYGLDDFSTSVIFNPIYTKNIFNFVFWFVPLMAMLCVSLKIIWALNARSLKKKLMTMRHNTNAVTAIGTEMEATNSSLTNKTVSTKNDSQAKASKSKNKKKFKIQPQNRFLFIILLYWIQWFIPCVAVLVDGLCDCVPISNMVPIYWLTYTVVLSDPLTNLILNPNVKFCWNK